MASSSTIDSQVGYATESTIGTYVAPTYHLEHVESTLKFNRNRIESAGVKAGRQIQSRWAAGIQWVEGVTKHELAPQSAGKLLRTVFGAVATTGAGPYTHTYTPGILTETQSHTVQVGKPDLGGTVRAFSYLGCQSTSFKLSCAIDQYAMGEFGWYGQHLDTGQSLVSAAYPGTYTPFTFVHATFTLGGSAREVLGCELTLDNGLRTGRHSMRATTPERPRQAKLAGLRQMTGSLDSDFIDLTELNRFINGTEAALVYTFDAGASAKLVITMNVRFDGEDPDVTGYDMLGQKLPFRVLSATSDALACTAVLTNGDSTP